MTTKEAKAAFILAASLLAGVLALGGCRTPVINYSIETKCNDIWHNQPKQSVAFKMDFCR